MILLPNSIYVELYSEMAEAILKDKHGHRELYVTKPNGDQHFTDEAQGLFEEYCSTVEGVLEAVGIGQDYDDDWVSNMTVASA